MKHSLFGGPLSGFPRIVGLLAVTAALATQAGEPVAQREYLRITAGEPSGSQTVKVHSDGRLSVHYAFNDRGWGPDITAEMRLDARGLLTSFSATGLNHEKKVTEEHFEIRDGMARWHSPLEQGEQRAQPGQLYFPVNQPPEFRAVLARALLARPERRINLLPAGSARIEEIERKTFAVAGELRTITLYAISGLELMPDYVWLDEDDVLVGYSAGWSAVLLRSWRELLPEIKAAQEAALARHVHSQAKTHRRRIERPIAVVNARILDLEAGRLTPHVTVLLRNGLIEQIGSDLALPTGVHTVDAGGKTLMPALWDMHAHMKPANYLHYIAAGVLNVRDMGNDPAYMARLRQDIATGTIAAPDVYPMGFIDQRGPYAAPTGRLVETLDEARRYVRTYASEGYIGIKLYGSIDPAWVPVLTREARALGLPTAGHIPSFMGAAQAIGDGYDEVTHINMMLLQLIGDWTIDTRTALRMTVPSERGGKIDLEAPRSKAFLDLMVGRSIAHDPTLAVSMDRYWSRPGEIIPSAIEYADHLPASLRRDHIARVSHNDGQQEAFRRTGELALKLVKRLHERGVHILPGTDAWLPAFTLISELEYYAQAGIGNVDVLRLATIKAAQHLGLDGELGSVTAGKKAYLMLVEGDPINDLSALRKVRWVVKGDGVFSPGEILRSQGIEPF